MEHRAIRPVAWAEHIALVTALIALFSFSAAKAAHRIVIVLGAADDRLVLNWV
jgi:hypothetical protein